MPNDKGYGHSRATPHKQRALDMTLGPVIGSGVMVARQRRCVYHVLDMTAGPGLSADGDPGSPIIIARHIQQWWARGHRLTFACVDWDAKTISRLHEVMSVRFPDLHVDYYTNQTEALASIPKHAVGLTYWDPTQYKHLDADLLSSFSRTHRTMDVLLTRECLAGYRMQSAAHCPGTLTIQDYLALTGKKKNYIMQYTKHGWWSLGFADNWTERPTSKLKGFEDVSTAAGAKIWRKWTLGAKLPETELEDQTPQQGVFSWAI